MPDLTTMPSRPFRAVVQWPATVEAGAWTGKGDVLDANARGVFLHLPGFHTAQLQPGTPIRLWITPPAHAGLLEVIAVVRWRGAHRGHRCEGYGIQLGASAPPIERWMTNRPR